MSGVIPDDKLKPVRENYRNVTCPKVALSLVIKLLNGSSPNGTKVSIILLLPREHFYLRSRL